MMISRALYKIGKKLCFPSVPSTWVPRTVEAIQRVQDIYERRKNLKHCSLPLPKFSDYEEEEEEDRTFTGIRGSYYTPIDKFDDGFTTPKDDLLWSDFQELQSEDYIRENENEEESVFLKEGQTFDVISLLSASGSGGGYLVRNNGDKVQVAESLRGKNILVCCFLLPIFWRSLQSNSIRGIITAFSQLNRGCGGGAKYEMVMVAKICRNWADDDDEDAFNHFFSGFPSSWLAVPFSDVALRHLVCNSLHLRFTSVTLLVDPNQKVLCYQSPFGRNGFDYIPLCLPLPGDDPDYWWKTHSQLHSILDSDYVFKMTTTTTTNNNAPSVLGIHDANKVSISQLKGKLVALYLCYNGSLIRTLDVLSQKCKARNQDFQIVLVYLPYRHGVDPPLFQEAINHVLHNLNISVDSNWWVAPFNDFVSRTLWEVGGFFNDDQLVILDPCTNTADPYGKQVIDWFGVNSYPFTREFLFRRELEALRAVTLESLLVYGSRDYVFRIDNLDEVRVPIAELSGKTVLLYLDKVEMSSKNYYTLLEWYNRTKTTNSVCDLEVVFVQRSFGSPRPMPWLVCPYDAKHTAIVMRKILMWPGYNSPSMLVAFGKDGHVNAITLNAIDLLESYGPKGFPSYDGLRNEVVKYFNAYYYDLDMDDVLDG